MNPRDTLGRIHSIETFGAVDGPGVRFVVFLQGCPLRCLYCHNPDSWNPKDGKLISVGELIDNMESYKNYLSGGLTISGGEPMMQKEFSIALLQEAKNIGLHTALDTSGAFALEHSKAIVDVADLLLLDIKAATPERYLQITGRDFAYTNAFANLEYCEQTHKPVWIRHVLLNEYTLHEAELHLLAQTLSKYSCIERVELLPFHKMGEYKWGELRYEYKLFSIPAPNKNEIQKAKDIFKQYKLNVY